MTESSPSALPSATSPAQRPASPPAFKVRPTQPADLHALTDFIGPFVAQGRLLPRTTQELDELVANGFIAVAPLTAAPATRGDEAAAPPRVPISQTACANADLVDAAGQAIGKIVGFAALEVYSPKLAEIRSLAVAGEWQGQGVGRALVQACVDRARFLDVFEVLAVTSSEEFFRRCGFDFTLPGEKKALFLQTRPEY